MEVDEHFEKWRKLVRVQQDVRRKIIDASRDGIILKTNPSVCACHLHTDAGRYKKCPGQKRPRVPTEEQSSARQEGQKKKKRNNPSESKAISAFIAGVRLREEEIKEKQIQTRKFYSRLNEQVLQVHGKMEEEHFERLARIQKEKIECLQRSDFEGYLKLASEIKSVRIQEILERTEGCLRKLQTSMTALSEKRKDITYPQNPSEAPQLLSSADIAQPNILSGGVLHPYQMDGLKWLASLHSRGLNGILADEMGLGKTVQVIALACHLVEERGLNGPFLIAAPASVLPNWMKELQHWAPGLRAVSYSGDPEMRLSIFKATLSPLLKCAKGKKAGQTAEGLPQIVVTTYEMLMGKKDRQRLSSIPWLYIILDEGHRIKNAECKLNAELKNYRAAHRLLLSGTPIQNNLDELWSLLNFLLPTIFDSSDDFNAWFSLPLSNTHKGSAKRAGHTSSRSRAEEALLLSEEEKLLVVNRLHQMLRPLMLRRLKSSVLGELPSKRECLVKCMPSAYQQLLCWYVALLGSERDQARSSSRTQQKGQKDSSMSPAGASQDLHELVRSLFQRGKKQRLSVTNAVMEMRVICNHPFMSKLHSLDIETSLHAAYLQQFGGLKGKSTVPDDEDISARATLANLLGTSGKLEVLHRILSKLWIGGHRVLIFCTMTKMLDVIEEYLEAREEVFNPSDECSEQSEEKSVDMQNPSSQPLHAAETAEGTGPLRCLADSWKYCRIDGTTSKEDRQDLIAQFNAEGSEIFIFLLSIRAGGQGINLQSADTVIMHDTDWNPQIDLQAQARAHRMGQKKDVLVIRMETMKTVEQRVRDAAEQKLGLAHQSVTAGFFDGKTSDKDRRRYLEDLLQEKNSTSDVLSPSQGNHPTDTDLSELIFRGEPERDAFKMLDECSHDESNSFKLIEKDDLHSVFLKAAAEAREL